MSAFSLFENIWEDLSPHLPDLGRHTVILPGRRAAFQLRRELTVRSGRTLIAPRIITITDWVEEIAGCRTLNAYDLFLRLYEDYRALVPGDRAGFEVYSSLGSRILRDFDELDRYLVPIETFFSRLTEWSELENWGISVEDPDSELMQGMNQTLGLLGPLYERFTVRLRDENLAYPGLLYRWACEGIRAHLKGRGHAEHYLFTGFNALSRSEEVLIRTVLEMGMGEAYWDIGPSFLRDTEHDMGFFIRRYTQNWDYYQEHTVRLCTDYSQHETAVRVYPCAHPIEQSEVVRELLSQVNTPESTAVIPCDEGDTDLLLAQVSREFESAEDINVSSGISSLRHPLSSFLQQVLSFHARDHSRGWTRDSVKHLCTATIPYLNSGSPMARALNELRAFTRKSHRTHIQREDLPEGIDRRFIDILLPARRSGKPYLNALHELIRELQSSLTRASAIPEQFADFLDRTFGGDLLDGPVIQPRLVQRLYLLYAQNRRLFYPSEADAPLQITGILETRNLSYMRLIMTSVNEGILPLAHNPQSLVPLSLKGEFELPGIKEKDAIYAYHFYRLLSHSREAHLLYCRQGDGLHGAEQSRFISQLLFDPPPTFQVEVCSPEKETPLSAPRELEVHKTPALIERLQQICTKGISASALIRYLSDPRSFYMERVLSLREPEDFTGELPPRLFGTIIHDSLQELYIDLGKNSISAMELEALKGLVPGVVDSQYRKTLKGLEKLEGVHLLARKAILQVITSFLEQEIIQARREELIIHSLEQERMVPLNAPGLPCDVHLKGIVDRVEESRGVVRIMDYKTGAFNENNLKIPEDLSLIFEKINKYKELFQLLYYALLMKPELGDRPFSLGIISLVKHRGDRHYVYLDKKGVPAVLTDELLNEFSRQLATTIGRLLDPEAPLMENPESSL